MPTVAELIAQKDAPRPKATVTVTLVSGQHLLDEMERLNNERVDLLVAAARTDDDGNATKPPRKGGEKDLPPRVEEIDARIKALTDELPAHQGEVTLTGLDGGAWQRWKDAHPPREDNAADQGVAGGHCNASDLFADLGRFVTAWDGEDLGEGVFDDHLAAKITYADLRDLVTHVVAMHENRVPRLPKSSNASPETEASATD